MIIELRGVEFHNKGAELMLHAIMDVVKKQIPDVVFVMEKRPSATIKQQRSLGIYTKLNVKKYGIDSAKWGRFMPKFLMRSLGFVHEKDIQAVLDGSGFAFGDFWGEKKAGERLANHIEKWKRQGKKVIMLPQAFGAFENPALQQKMRIILDQADLVFARDQYSLAYLNGLQVSTDRIHLRPDFTNLIKGKVPDYFNPKETEVAIIPNNKLLESNIFTHRGQYLERLHDLVVLIERHGKIPFFLIHEGKKDLQLAEDVNTQFSKTVKIIKEDDPLKVKGIIGACKGVVTSRFHGLVSALSQAVPCLCIGWSHKYQALMEDYNFKEGGIGKEDMDLESLEAKISLILDEKSAAICKQTLADAGAKQKELSKQMWEQVFYVLRN